MTRHWTDALARLHPCPDALTWAKTQSDYETAWATCPRGDWLLWLASRLIQTDAEHKRVVWVACQCARLALPYAGAHATAAARAAIDTAERWTQGLAPRQDVRAAAAYASAAAAAANTAYAAYASAAAANAARAAADAAYAAYADAAYDAYAAAANAAYAAAAYDAYAAAANAARAAAADARAVTLVQCADLARAEWPTPPPFPLDTQQTR